MAVTAEIGQNLQSFTGNGPSLAMMTFTNERKILEWNEKLQTNNHSLMLPKHL